MSLQFGLQHVWYCMCIVFTEKSRPNQFNECSEESQSMNSYICFIILILNYIM